MIATTISQSKHLLELGIDPNTADMHWYLAENIEYLYIGKSPDANAIPAWSLSALLDLIPFDPSIQRLSNGYSCECSGDDFLYSIFGKETPFVAAVDLLELLVKNKLL